ncbi:MAG: hydroxymethylglutaryl-CoA lyase [Luteibaculaceae bacterium]
MPKTVKIIECPRDAMQGIKKQIPTDAKIEYLNLLLKAGFHTLDFGSYVSPKAIPQMADTQEVLDSLTLSGTDTKLLAIVANERGAEQAAKQDRINYLGFPYSISETFQQRNTNASLQEGFNRLKEISKITEQGKKELVIYISMAFGNPYKDPFSSLIAVDMAKKLYEELGCSIIALSDTIGMAEPNVITELFTTLIPQLPQVEFGAHFHTTPLTWKEKVDSAYKAGCTRFDGALLGYGGCPMAADALTGNMPTEKMIQFLEDQGVTELPNNDVIRQALEKAQPIFN